MSSTFYTNSCNTTNFKSGTSSPDEPIFQTIIKEWDLFFIMRLSDIAFDQFQETNFYKKRYEFDKVDLGHELAVSGLKQVFIYLKSRNARFENPYQDNEKIRFDEVDDWEA